MSLAAQIERDEGRVNHAYQDHLGYWTIGVGFLIDERRGGTIPDAVIDFWLDYKISEIRRQLEKKLTFFKDLSETRQDAIINMAYQLGVNGVLNFKKMTAALSAADYNLAADHALDSLWARQTPARARRVSEQIRSGEFV